MGLIIYRPAGGRTGAHEINQGNYGCAGRGRAAGWGRSAARPAERPLRKFPEPASGVAWGRGLLRVAGVAPYPPTKIGIINPRLGRAGRWGPAGLPAGGPDIPGQINSPGGYPWSNRSAI